VKVAPRRAYVVPLPGGRELALGPRTLVMGVINVTPDSFSDGGLRLDPAAAIDAGLAMAEAGADILDIGGESTRPGADAVDAAEERRRVLPVVSGLARQASVPLSIDTYKAEVAAAALDAGASLVNDISGLRYEPELARVAAAAGAGLVLMHTRGRSKAMYEAAEYRSVVDEVAAELRESLDRAVERGVPREAIILDPGLGFAKRADHSFEALAHLDALPLVALDRPWLIGPSRKSFLTAATGPIPPEARDWATAAAVAVAILAGAHIVRVHRVAEMVQAARVADRVRALLEAARSARGGEEAGA
jgi:dihydropteroate synthase